MNRDISPGAFWGIVAVLAVGLLVGGYWFVVRPSGGARDTGYRPPLPPPPGGASSTLPGAHASRSRPQLPLPPPPGSH